MVFTTLTKLTAARRIPLIKFRKGGHSYTSTPATTNQASANPPSTSNKQSGSNAIEDWELPPRYWRKPIDAAEMEYINRGGPA